MGEDPRSTLRGELGDAAAEALAPLSDADAERFATLLAKAREREAAALRDAAEASLSFVPRFARGAVKKIVFG
jgi:hypothetical protein